MLVNNEFNNIILMLVVATGIAILLITLNSIMGGYAADPEITSSFECGFDPYQFTNIPFNLHFFLIVILFLLFDLELILLLPILYDSLTMTTYTVLNIFILQLTLGYVFEYRTNALNWIKIAA
jgi:NADH:ubiquinone oxidoreductase subunit 3 (subunit A)